MIVSFKKLTKISLFILIILSLSFFVYLKYFSKKKGNGPDQIRITFREGLNIHEVADLLQSNGIVKKQVFFDTCKEKIFKDEYDFLKYESKDKYFTLEGYLFPDTYDFLKNEDPVLVIKKFLNNFREKTKDLKIPKGFNLEQILMIASFLEAESNFEASNDVSSVIHNRIKTMETNGKNKFGEYGLNFFQLDSTMYYPYRTKDETPKNFKSTYNTYEIKGFPPGPICSPGMNFIMSALNPNETDYFYFFSDPEENIYFSKTYPEHVRKMKEMGIR